MKYISKFAFWISLFGVITGMLSLAVDGYSLYRLLILAVNFGFLLFWASDDSEVAND